MHVKKKVKHDAAFFEVTRDDAGGSSNDIHSLGGGGGGGRGGGGGFFSTCDCNKIETFDILLHNN